MRMPARTKRKSSAGKVGRPPAGDAGERVKDYPQVSFRLPMDVRNKLWALATVRKQPQWRVIIESLNCYLRDLPRRERANISRLLPRRRSKAV
jgi:hypothetical protein